MTDEELISEYADGRLDAPAAAAFEARLKAEPALASRLRLLRAMKGALASAAVPAPADLRASLRAAARERSEPVWKMLLREAFAVKPWSVAAASAFAAALFVLATRPERRAPPPVAAVPAPSAPDESRRSSELNRALGEELWSDDEGGDDDAI